MKQPDSDKLKSNRLKKHGGTRQGSGAKPKYNEETTTIAFRCPKSKAPELKVIINKKLEEWMAIKP